MSRSAPIGIFDSGLGGLSILKALKNHLPHESFVYLGDTARVPYGTKSPNAIVRYSLNNAKFLCDHSNIKLLIIACHTASAYALNDLQKALNIPVIGMIEPTTKALSKNHSADCHVGILSTAATARSNAYATALKSASFSGSVTSIACPLFVTAAEEGITDGPLAEQIADHYLRPQAAKFDSIILGCTHFPLLKQMLTRLYPQIQHWYDAGEECAIEAKNLLTQKNLLQTSNKYAQTTFWFTDTPTCFKEVSERFLGYEMDTDSFQIIDLDHTEST